MHHELNNDGVVQITQHSGQKAQKNPSFDFQPKLRAMSLFPISGISNL